MDTPEETIREGYGYREYPILYSGTAAEMLKDLLWTDDYEKLSERCKERMVVVMDDYAKKIIATNRRIIRLRLECYKAIGDSVPVDEKTKEAEKLLHYLMSEA